MEGVVAAVATSMRVASRYKGRGFADEALRAAVSEASYQLVAA